MSMTREEAAHILEYSRIVSENFTQEAVTATYVMALAALRGPTREQAEKIRGEWVQNRNAIIDSIMCSKCGAIYQAYYGGYPYCPRCGAPMTDEAVDMVMERLEALRGETETD